MKMGGTTFSQNTSCVPVFNFPSFFIFFSLVFFIFIFQFYRTAAATASGVVNDQMRMQIRN
jgi:hypothetical protein